MAEVTAFRNNASVYPIYGLPYTVVLPILDADGDPVTGGTIDSLVSLNGDTAAAGATPVQIATTTGLFYLALTAANMTADIVSGSIGSTTSGAKRTLFTLYPRKLPILLTSDNAGAYDSTTTLNLGAGASAIDDFYNGCLVYIYGGTGNGQVRMITDYVGSTKIATVHVAWATNPDATSDLKIYRTEQAPYSLGVNVTHIAGTAQTARDIGASVLLSSGSGAGQLDFTSGVVKANLAQILGTALTETAGYLAAAFKKFFNILNPVSTMDVIATVTTVGTCTTNTDMRGTDNAALATELAKVPKSDSNVTWNATALASINAEVDTALNDADLNAVYAAVLKNRKILINKLVITDANGNATLYDDDDTTPLFQTLALLTKAGGYTTRLRFEEYEE